MSFFLEFFMFFWKMIKSYDEAMKYIFDFERTKDYSLEKVKICAEKLWNPQNSYKIIHITWTNGKWSTCNMCFSVLKKRWKKVWIFTSPHLLDIRERFRSEKWMISKSDFVALVNKVLDLNIDISYFEKCTLIAFEYFKQIWCEYVVLEVWMWWLLDSTNIITPEITAITSIGYDHMELLWSTLEEIAYQKAGIIKTAKPVVLNIHNEVIEKTAKEKQSPIFFTDKLIKTNLVWNHQKKNAALAYEICKYIWVPENIISEWFKEVEHRWRLEYLKSNLIVDWAHNEQWLESLKTYLSDIKKKYDKIFYCFSVKKGKDIKKLVIDRFWTDKDYIIVEQNHYMLEKLENIEKQIKWVKYQIKKPDKIKELAEKNRNILYVVFWSLYMIWGFYI